MLCGVRKVRCFTDPHITNHRSSQIEAHHDDDAKKLERRKNNDQQRLTNNYDMEVDSTTHHLVL
jgi:hypothetical protein